jgi:hypothetical protein
MWQRCQRGTRSGALPIFRADPFDIGGSGDPVAQNETDTPVAATLKKPTVAVLRLDSRGAAETRIAAIQTDSLGFGK